MSEVIEEVKSETFFGLIDADRLKPIDKLVLEAARTYANVTEPSYMGVKTSDTWTIRVFGAQQNKLYFAFAGYHDQGINFGILSTLFGSDLLQVARDKEYLELIEKAEAHPQVTVRIPTTWTLARHNNQGLYDEARQFEISPPCLLLTGYCKPQEIMDVVGHLSSSYNAFKELSLERARE